MSEQPRCLHPRRLNGILNAADFRRFFRGGNDEYTAVFIEQLGALVVTRLVGVGGADEHAGSTRRSAAGTVWA
jgi:hypothetical protein